MSTQVSAFQPVVGTPALVREPFLGVPDWLPDAEHLDQDRWTMRVHGGGISRQVVVRVGEPWTVGSTSWRSLSWDPVDPQEAERPGRLSERLLPSFDGELGIDLREQATSLVLDGRYQPPGGWVGAAIDSVALHRLARATVQRLLADVAQTLASRASVLRARYEPVAGPGDGDEGHQQR